MTPVSIETRDGEVIKTHYYCSHQCQIADLLKYMSSTLLPRDMDIKLPPDTKCEVCEKPL